MLQKVQFSRNSSLSVMFDSLINITYPMINGEGLVYCYQILGEALATATKKYFTYKKGIKLTFLTYTVYCARKME